MLDVFYDAYLVLSKVYSDGAFIDKAITETNIEPSNKPKTVKICYGVLDKDIYLDYCIDALCIKKPKQKIRILLKIAMYSQKFLGKKTFTVTDAIVELTKKLGKSANAGFINAVLRKFYSTDIILPEDNIERLSVECSTPLFAVKKLVSEYGEERARSILSFDKDHTFVRFSDGATGVNYLTDNGFLFERTPFDDLFSVRKLTKNQDFDNGVFTFQSIGSAAICALVGFGKTLLDACSAPGGKTCYLAKKFDTVTALELHEHRAKLVENYAKRMGIDNVTVEVFDATKEKKEYFEKFSAVLCDVPCSGFGTLKDNPDIKLRRTESDVDGLLKTQLDILSACSSYVEVGGKLVYSTCSYFEEENDKNVEKFLKGNDRFISETVSSPLPFVRKKYGLQFLPDISMGAGYYCSVLKRVK